VSSSSGHPRLCPPPPARHYGPGRVFADETRSYDAAMDAFVRASAVPPTERAPDPLAPAAAQQRAARREVRQAETRLREQRRQQRGTRAAEDAAWRAAREQRRASAGWGAGAEQEAAWRAARAARRAAQEARAAEDAAWRAARQALREQATGLAGTTVWLAVLILIDSCTRQCLGVPVFASGAHVTAAEVVAALTALWPAGVRYLITDRGTHFTATVFEEALRAAGVTHVLTARHRPQSNGIAERLVRTFKEWLADKAWSGAAEAAEYGAAFGAEYNERPHQGRGLGGLAPNEVARRQQAALV
jgi:transposase InsO family protein